MAEIFTMEQLPPAPVEEEVVVESPVDLVLQRGIAVQETGGEEDPWIRTNLKDTPGGSTAYGPLQITGKTLDDLTDKQLEIKGISKLSDAEKELVKKLKKQSRQFAKHGNEQDKDWYNPRYDYGGTGDALTENEKKTYWKLGNKLFRLKAAYRNFNPDDLTPEELSIVVGDWYGKDKEYTNEYIQGVMTHLSSSKTGGMISRNPYPYMARPI